MWFVVFYPSQLSVLKWSSPTVLSTSCDPNQTIQIKSNSFIVSFLYLQLFPSTFNCSPLPSTVPLYLQLFPSTFNCSPLPSTVPLYLQLFPSTFNCSQSSHVGTVFTLSIPSAEDPLSGGRGWQAFGAGDQTIETWLCHLHFRPGYLNSLHW